MQNNDHSIPQKPDIEEALRFLKVFGEDESLDVFKTIEEPKPAEGSARVKQYIGTLCEHQDALLGDNLNGSGVFFTVNKTDGKGRKEENVVKVRSLFVDLDGSPLEPVLQGPLHPHMVIESSPGRYHAYWLVKDCPLDQFKKMQKYLAQRFSGDLVVCDLPRLMRLPGFFHRKKDLFKTRIIEISTANSYTLEAFQAAFEYNPNSKEEVKSSETRSEESSTLRKLKEKGFVKRQEDEEGRVLIRCPWGSEHTSGGEDAYYFSKASKEYKGEGFKCFHAHCKERDIRALRFFLGLMPIEGLDPLPLFREIPPAIPFPVEALGSILGEATKEIHKTVKAPIAVIAQSLLGVASLVTQAHANIRIDGRTHALSLFLITVAESGERKSAVDDIALEAVLEWQKQLAQIYQEELQRYKISLESWRCAQKTSKKEVGSFNISEPKPPVKPLIIIEEPTYEGLVKYLEEGQPSIGLFSDEGGRFLGGSAMSRDNVLKTLAGFSSLWDAKSGKPITRIRSGDKTLALYGRRVALHLMIQESVYSQLSQQSMCESQGFLPRCLISFPESMAGRRSYVKADPTKAPAVCLFKEYCNRLIDRKFSIEPLSDLQNQLAPRTIELSEDAFNLWKQFHDALEENLAPGKSFHSIRRFGSKASEHLLRIAGVLAIFENPDAIQVDAEYIERAILILNYYLAERLRLESYHSIEPHLLEAQRVFDWALERGKAKIGLRELYQYGPSSIRSKNRATGVMRTLENHGRAFPIPAHELSYGAKGIAWHLIHSDKS